MSSSPRPFAHSVLVRNQLEVSICPDCGLLVAGSRSPRLLKIAEKAHAAGHRKPPVKVITLRPTKRLHHAATA